MMLRKYDSHTGVINHNPNTTHNNNNTTNYNTNNTPNIPKFNTLFTINSTHNTTSHPRSHNKGRALINSHNNHSHPQSNNPTSAINTSNSAIIHQSPLSTAKKTKLLNDKRAAGTKMFVQQLQSSRKINYNNTALTNNNDNSFNTQTPHKPNLSYINHSNHNLNMSRASIASTNTQFTPQSGFYDNNNSYINYSIEAQTPNTNITRASSANSDNNHNTSNDTTHYSPAPSLSSLSTVSSPTYSINSNNNNIHNNANQQSRNINHILSTPSTNNNSFNLSFNGNSNVNSMNNSLIINDSPIHNNHEMNVSPDKVKFSINIEQPTNNYKTNNANNFVPQSAMKPKSRSKLRNNSITNSADNTPDNNVIRINNFKRSSIADDEEFELKRLSPIPMTLNELDEPSPRQDNINNNNNNNSGDFMLSQQSNASSSYSNSPGEDIEAQSIIKRRSKPIKNTRLLDGDSDLDSDHDNNDNNNSKPNNNGLPSKTPKKLNNSQSKFQSNLSAQFDEMQYSSSSTTNSSNNNSLSASPMKFNINNNYSTNNIHHHPTITIPGSISNSKSGSAIHTPHPELNETDFLSPVATLIRQPNPFDNVIVHNVANDTNNSNNNINNETNYDSSGSSEPQSPRDTFSMSLLSPDPKAFTQSSELRLKGRTSNDHNNHYVQCPPSPTRPKKPQRLLRSSSLYDSKILLSFTVDTKQNSGPIFATQFTNPQLIGTGSFFNVFKVTHRTTGEVYAIKRSLQVLRGKKDRESYLREVKLLHMLGPHNNIIKHFRAWQEEAHFYIQMEYCPTNLSDHAAVTLNKLGNNIDLRDLQLSDWCIQLSRALHHVHKSGLLHLDIKPENVLVSNDNILKLGDFGQARLKQDIHDGSEGDSVYMAPELLQHNISKLVSPATDIFSLGLLLFELATQTILPKEGLIWHQLREGKAAQYIKGKVNIILQNLIVDMLNPQPKLRPTAVNIIERLLPFIQQLQKQIKNNENNNNNNNNTNNSNNNTNNTDDSHNIDSHNDSMSIVNLSNSAANVSGMGLDLLSPRSLHNVALQVLTSPNISTNNNMSNNNNS